MGIADRAELKERREIARGALTASCAASINGHVLVTDVVPQLLAQLSATPTISPTGMQTDISTDIATDRADSSAILDTLELLVNLPTPRPTDANAETEENAKGKDATDDAMDTDATDRSIPTDPLGLGVGSILSLANAALAAGAIDEGTELISSAARMLEGAGKVAAGEPRAPSIQSLLQSMLYVGHQPTLGTNPLSHRPTSPTTYHPTTSPSHHLTTIPPFSASLDHRLIPPHFTTSPTPHLAIIVTINQSCSCC